MPDHYVLHASGLMSRYGFGSGLMPLEVIEHAPADMPEPVEPTLQALWQRSILPELVRCLLVPRIPLGLHLYEAVEGNPVRTFTVDGFPVNGRYRNTATMLRPYQVSVPWAAIGEYLAHRNAYLAAGRSLRSLLVGLAAGFSEPEIRAHIDEGRVDLDGWLLLFALRS